MTQQNPWNHAAHPMLGCLGLSAPAMPPAASPEAPPTLASAPTQRIRLWIVAWTSSPASEAVAVLRGATTPKTGIHYCGPSRYWPHGASASATSAAEREMDRLPSAVVLVLCGRRYGWWPQRSAGRCPLALGRVAWLPSP
eukprot:6971098-Prymnesium_polylepis.1